MRPSTNSKSKHIRIKIIQIITLLNTNKAQTMNKINQNDHQINIRHRFSIKSLIRLSMADFKTKPFISNSQA